MATVPSPLQAQPPLPLPGDPLATIERARERAVASDDWGTTSPVRVELPGVGQAWQINELVYAGTDPPQEETLARLEELGVRTLISMDFVPPDRFLAGVYGMESVHAPSAHGRIRMGDFLRTIRPFTHLAGPFYLHGAPEDQRPLAVAAMADHLWERREANRALYLMREMGVPESEVELWFSASHHLYFHPQDTYLLSPSDFPPALEPPPLRWMMQQLGESHDYLREAASMRWRTPPDAYHSTPASEAQTLWRSVRSVRRVRANDPEEWQEKWQALEEHAEALHNALSEGNTEAATRAWQGVGASCAECHKAHRDR